MEITMKIGIPQALTFYWLYPMWKTFLQNLDFEIVTSGKTTSKTVNTGCKLTVDEACLPLKVFVGHCINLQEKADALFIPSLKSIEEKRYFCPKIIALPEIINKKVNIPVWKIVINNYTSEKNDIQSYIKFAKKLGFSSYKINESYQKAKKIQNLYNELLIGGYTPLQALNILDVEKYQEPELNKKMDIKIAVLGNPYITYDSFLNFDLRKKLLCLGSSVYTSELLTKKNIDYYTSHIKKDLFWTYPRRLTAAAPYFIKKNIDGIILLSSFACGSDAIIKPFISSSCENKVPFININIDEHTGQGGFLTRIEAFIDMIKRNKRSRENESRISSYG
jgi:predicted nucleotide-binding protein (sugar kinase/HSP70/actin superfamily)